MLTRADLLTDFSIQASLHASLYSNNAVGPNQHQPFFFFGAEKEVSYKAFKVPCFAPHRSVFCVLMKQLFRVKGVYTDYKLVAHVVNSISSVLLFKKIILYIWSLVTSIDY